MRKIKSHWGNLDSNTHANISPKVCFLAFPHATFSLANRQDRNREGHKGQQSELVPWGNLELT